MNNNLSAKEQLRELAVKEAFSRQNAAKPLSETDNQIVNRRRDFFGDAFIPGDTQRFVLIYHRSADAAANSPSGFVAEIVSITPRSETRLLDEYVYGGLTSGSLPRFYAEGIHEPEVLLASVRKSTDG